VQPLNITIKNKARKVKTKMKKYNIKLESICTMLHHGSQAVGMEEPQTKRKGGSAVHGDKDEWKKTIYYDEQHGVYLPAINMEACMKEAAKQFKIGRGTATKYINSGVFCTEEHLPLYINGTIIKTLDDPRITIDKRTIKNPNTKGRQVRYRAKFNQWTTEFQLMVTADDYIDKKLLTEIIKYGGNFIGIGDFRPRFGRYKLISITEVN